jgi:hypothetical protein
VGAIPIGNVFGAVRFARVYHAPYPDALTSLTGQQMDEAGFSAFPVESIAPPRTRFAYATLVPQPPGVAEVRKAFNAVLHAGPVHVRWKSTGFAPVAPTFDVGGLEVKLTPDDFKDL